MEAGPVSAAVGRFAPSPSGRLHLGNLACSLLAWLSAKRQGGRIVLRIEDLDAERCPRRYADQLEEDLAWLGLVWDEGGSRVRPLFQALAETVRQGGYGAALLAQAQFRELRVEVNRVVRGGHRVGAAGGDSKVVSLLQYLNLHLADPLTIDELAARFYISKYHMMRRFRQETGYSVHGYLTEKRLLLARQLLGQGCTPAEAAAQAGYQDYSTFSRAYKKQFGHGPSADTKGKQQDLQITTQEF